VAPLIGLAGTVWGMARAFRTTAAEGAGAATVASGVLGALTATGILTGALLLGLFVYVKLSVKDE
jgi:biopolymer transport protein ExbB/TolQ